ncbi:MAG: glycosyltransferase family 4 protein [Candidatus Eisenbacteria bacterium]
MKIGIVTPTFHPYPGGVGEHVHHEYLELAKLGHDVRIVTSRFGPGESPVEPHVIRVGRSVQVPANGSMCPVAVRPRMRARLREIFESEAFDVLHVHEPLMPFLCLAAIDAAAVPVVGTFHASNDSALGYRMFESALAPRFRKLTRRIAVSEAARSSVAPYFGGTYDIVPNGVDLERFSLARPLPKLQDGSYNVLFVGRLEPRKGVKHLLRAMPEILRRVPEARLTVVGAGPMSNHYRKYLADGCLDRVSFEGRVSGDVLPRYFATADVYCSPATGGESFGIVLLEAMAAGAAIVASEIPGYRDVVEHGKTGLLVGPRSPGALAGAVARLHGDPALARRLVEGAREAVRRYAWEQVTAEILDVLLAAVSRPDVGAGDSEAGASPGRERERMETVV